MVLSFAVMPTVAPAQTFEKENFNYSDWTKRRFSEAVTVIGPGKMIFLAGVGSEDENGKGGDILYKGDFTAQCKYAFDKIKRALEKNGATLGDIAKMVTYSTDVRYQPDFGKRRQDTFGTTPMPAHTLLTISQLAWPGADRDRRHRGRPTEIGGAPEGLLMRQVPACAGKCARSVEQQRKPRSRIARHSRNSRVALIHPMS